MFLLNCEALHSNDEGSSRDVLNTCSQKKMGHASEAMLHILEVKHT